MKNIDTFNDIINYMSLFTNLEKNLNHVNTRTYRLDRMNKLLDHFNHPEKNFKSIHVAGSKGKGSTSIFIAKGLESQGFKVGLYASPHLLDYRERFTLCGTFFENNFLISCGKYLINKLNSFTFKDEWGEASPTTFELFTLYSFILFSESHCNWAVIETGLGGRLDATNTIIPVASVITPIELEHTNILGTTITAIATEKSKIIKKNIPSFIATMRDEAKEVMIEEAKNQNSEIHILEQNITLIKTHTTIEGEVISINWKDGREDNLILKLRGAVMANNAALALMTLKSLGFDNDKVVEAIETTTLPGRFETISQNPTLVIDGAHTPVSITSLINTVSQLYDKSKIVIIFGIIEDKDFTHIIQSLLTNFNTFIISKPGTFKKSDPKAIYNFFEQKINNNQSVILKEDSKTALLYAKHICPKDGIILCCGSFYMATEIAQANLELMEKTECH
ncbi:MAG: bifunctional folylpolyglutamate synthase/dihydrofolate synthase [Spirochaetaceae bacterium]|nr:bifunctional folylpolyglutamate synthase/dihydrofolate synthase [Spirochaetaceae bacterium]